MSTEKHYVSLSPAAMVTILKFMDSKSKSEFALMVVSGHYPAKVAITGMDTSTILTTLPLPLEPNTRITIKPVSRDARLLGLFEVISWDVLDKASVDALKHSFEEELLERSQELAKIINMLNSPPVTEDPLSFGKPNTPALPRKE